MSDRPDNTILVLVKSATRNECIYTMAIQSVCGFRALVGAKFQIELKSIILVYAGEMLNDVGTLAQHCIVDGATVYLVVRKHSWLVERKVNTTATARLPKAVRMDMVVTRYREHRIHRMAAVVLPKLETLLDDTELIREFVLNDPRMQRMMQQCPHIRHAMNSDASIREMTSTILNPAKMEELNRKRDLSLLRFESMAGGMAILQRINSCLHEPTDSPTSGMSCALKRWKPYNNPQLGKENRSPLPNPWTRSQRSRSFGVSNLSLNCLRRLSRYNAIMTRDVLHKVNKPNVHNTNLDWLEKKFKQLENYLNKRTAQATEGKRQNLAKSKCQRKPLVTMRLLFNEPVGNIMVEKVKPKRKTRAQHKNHMHGDTLTDLKQLDCNATTESEYPLTKSVRLAEDPEVRYHNQLEHLASLGFSNRDQNLRALTASLGDINGAVKRLKTTHLS